MMEARAFKPNPKYLVKMRLIMTLVAVMVMVFGVLFGWLISLDEGALTGFYVMVAFFIGDLVWWLPAMILAAFYYRSLTYEIHDDEVIVHVGIWTKSIKHVPYRTVTNLKTNRDIFDRWLFGLGALNVQTAGMSGTKGAEESLVGLENVSDIYDIVAAKLRKFRSAMAPTAAGAEHEVESGTGGDLRDLLEEVRAIRRAVENK